MRRKHPSIKLERKREREREKKRIRKSSGCNTASGRREKVLIVKILVILCKITAPYNSKQMVLSTAGSGKKKEGAVFQPGIYLRTYSPAISICDVAILIAKAEAAATALMDRNAATAAAAAETAWGMATRSD